MSKRDRIAAKKIEALEAEFIELLIPCLKECARGRWGLFGCYESLSEAKYWLKWQEADQLRILAKAIRKLRATSGEKNDLCEEYLLRCSFRRANDPGEPQMALELLNWIQDSKQV